VKVAVRVLRNFQAGAFCPAEMWSQLSEVLSFGDAREILDALPADQQSALRETYRERPLSLRVLRGTPARRQIKRWMRDSAASDTPAG
jgi:hypothetical protein